eukprot:s1986_g3.t1
MEYRGLNVDEVAMRTSRKVAPKTRASVAKKASVLKAPEKIAETTIGKRVTTRPTEGAEPVPGVVRFVGATKFADGIWMGIELDEPKGKNDGTVQEVSYFTAKPQHGLFVRLGKAELILDSTAAKCQSAVPTESPTDLRDGTRVSVKTLENSAGTVRFVGQTEFAEGDWIGVELDQPLGKNDGSVKGRAYFSCKPNHGIFARAGNLVTIPTGSLPEKPQRTAASESEASGPLIPLPTLTEAPEPAEENANKNGDMATEGISAKPLPAPSGDTLIALQPTVEELATRSRITKDLEDQFEEELLVFEARQLPETRMSMMVDDTVMKVQAAVAQDEAAPTQKKRRKRKARDPTGFGVFLRQKQAMDLSATFRDIANAAAREWADLGDEARAAFRSGGKLPRSTQAPKRFLPEPFSSAVYSMEAKAAGMESREAYTVLWHVDWGQVKGEAFSNEDDAESKFDELDGGEYAAMLVDKAYNEIKYYGTRGKVQTEMEEYWKRHFKGSKALDQIKKKNQPKESSAVEVEVKDHALDESLAELRKDHWVSQEEHADPVVFRWELDETRTKIEKCLCGDLFLLSPEKDKIGFLDLALERFDTVALKRDRTEGHVISVDKESRLCKVVFPERDGSARIGFQTLSSLMFQRRKTPDALRQLRAPDFFPPEEGDLHRVSAAKPDSKHRGNLEKAIPVKTVWEDDDTGNFCWTYGSEELDVRAASTTCTASGKVAIPFRFIPSPDIKKMVENSEEEFKKFKDRKTPQGKMEDGVTKPTFGVCCSHRGSASWRRQGLTKRGAVCADPIRVRKRRPRVDVKCTGQAFLCKPGSRLGLLATNDFSLPYISRCVAATEMMESGLVKVNVDNSEAQLDIDPRPSQAVQLSNVCYEGGRKLTVLLESGRLIDATVQSREARHRHVIAYTDGNGGWCCTVIYIDTAVQKSKTKMPDIKSLADLLLGSGDGRFIGEQIVYRCLMVAGPGTGKTWSSCQLMYHLSKVCANESSTEGIVKVPVLIFAQKLAGMIRGHQMNDKIYAEMPLSERDALLDKPWLEDAFRMECGKEYADVLLRALKLRSAIVILDGIDEASDVKGIMQDFVMKRLVAMQISVVLTSRPEGVSAALSTLTQSFAVMSLKPLSDEQQKQIILHQVKVQKNEFFENLLKFAEIRKEHDRIYFNEAFADPKDRGFMEHKLAAVNRFKKDDGSWDESKLQKCLSGEVVGAQELGAEPQATYLQNASDYFSEDLFRELDARLEKNAPAKEVESFVKETFPATEDFPPGPSLARKLYELAEKKAMSTTSLWPQVVSVTDQLLAAAEYFKPIFEETVNALCQHVQDKLTEKAAKDRLEGKDAPEESTEYELILGPLKDPVRVHEKAVDDYADRFKEHLAEANVVDVIRARLVCSSGKQMKTFLEMIAIGFPYEVDGKAVKLELARVKNKFSSKDSDPSRFRNVLLNLELSCGQISHFVELQVHHQLILGYNETSHAHDFYDYFRRELRNTYGQDMEHNLNFMLEQRMQLFKEISEVPVLLTVMTMALLNSSQMPGNLLELYERGLRNMLLGSLKEEQAGDAEVAAIWEMMQKVAVENHFRQKRIFTQHDVDDALSTSPELHRRWLTCVENGEVPFVKVLSDGEGAEFQFRHLSFQEALVARCLASRDGKEEDAPPTEEAQTVAQRFVRHQGSLAQFINTPFYLNMLRTGAGQLWLQ